MQITVRLVAWLYVVYLFTGHNFYFNSFLIKTNNVDNKTLSL